MASACLASNGILRTLVARDGDVRLLAADVDLDGLAAEVADQVLARLAAIGAAADEGDHVIEMVERDPVAFQDVLALARPLE